MHKHTHTHTGEEGRRVPPQQAHWHDYQGGRFQWGVNGIFWAPRFWLSQSYCRWHCHCLSFIFKCTYTWIYTYIYVYIYIYLHIYMYVCTFWAPRFCLRQSHCRQHCHCLIFIFKCIYIWICTYIYMYICTYISIRICMYAHFELQYFVFVNPTVAGIANVWFPY